jgi:LmbE family N-acetylglucosaminyl deacetylase
METPLSRGRAALGGVLGLALGLGILMSSHTEAEATPHAGRLRLEIERLRVLGRALYLAAHPDDENTRVLAWLVAERRVRAAYLSLTRGGGGQNLIGAERGVAVAMLRTQELAAARGVDGAEQLFSRARDFGYSKRADETLRVWDEQAVLGDVVWTLRRYRPDVVLTRFAGDGSGRHGHHTASAQLALRAFALAKDPKAFPEQLRAGVSPWQPKRVLWNAYHWRPVPAAKLRGALAVDVGAYSPLLGQSVAEIAAQSRTMHKSQGFGSSPRRGRKIERFKLLAGAPAKRDLFEGIELSWRRVPGGVKVDRELAAASRALDASAPERAIPALSRAGAAMRVLAAHRDKDAKLADLGRTIARCAGLHTEARADRALVVPGDSLAVELRLLSRRGAKLRLERVRWPDGSTQRLRRQLPAGKLVTLKRRVALPAKTPISQPYWLASTPQAGSYAQPRDPALRGQPAGPKALAAELTFVTEQGFRFSLRRPLHRFSVDRVRGELRDPVLVSPPVLIAPEARVLVFPRGASQRLQVTLRAAKAGVRGTLRPALPTGWRAAPQSASFALSKSGDEARITFELRPPRNAATRRDELRLIAEVGGKRYERGLLRVDHGHIEPISAFPKASVALVALDLKLGGKRLGYLMGAGDELPASLRRVGYAVTALKVGDLDAARLRRFDAVVLGVRAYNTHPELAHRRPALEAYLRGGGTVVVQYNTSSSWRPLKVPVGPYPLSISRGRITDETAKLSLLAPRHRALRAPNRITAADFDGWVQERGLYFARRWDKRYTPLLAGRDPKERRDQRGALLVAKVGKGHYVYTGLSFFRQLPAGVPGAYRLLANLLAL